MWQFFNRQHTSDPLGHVCAVCGGAKFRFHTILWPELVSAWGLSETEENYINRQQGMVCVNCQCNLRSIGLAAAILQFVNFKGTFQEYCQSKQAEQIRILEVNTAGHLNPWLSNIKNHVLACYPEVDMQEMPYQPDSFDLVVHSDTREHVPNPVLALSECNRVLRSEGGACIFTIPLVIGRLTRRRNGLKASFHGGRDNPPDCRVETEYGADAWLDVLEAGFSECRLLKIDLPACIPFVAIKHVNTDRS